MGLCRQFLSLLLASLVFVAIAAILMPSSKFDGDMERLDTVSASVIECMNRIFSYVWNEIHKTKDCVAAMYQRRIPEIKRNVMKTCEHFESNINTTYLHLLSIISRVDDLSHRDITTSILDVIDIVRQLETCLTSRINKFFAAENVGLLHLLSAEVSGPQCVRGLQEVVIYFIKDQNPCLKFPTVIKGLFDRLYCVEILAHLLLSLALFVVMKPTLSRLSIRTRNFVIVFVLGILLLFVVCHFCYRDTILTNLLGAVFTPGFLSNDFLQRIVVVDLDENIGRNLTDWDDNTHESKLVRRYPGEDVRLYCGVFFFFSTKTKPKDRDIEVEWFHGHRRLEPAMKYRKLHYTNNILGDGGYITSIILVNNLTINDFGIYKCDISRRSQRFLISYTIKVKPSEVRPISPREISLAVPPGSMVKVRYSFVHHPTYAFDAVRFNGIIHHNSEKLELDQSMELCSLWTLEQNELYRISHCNRAKRSDLNIALLSFCVPFGYSRKHEFVSKRLVHSEFETLIHPVSVIVKSTGSKDQNHEQGTSTGSEYLDFRAAASNVIDILVMLIPLSFVSDILNALLTFIFLLVLKYVLKTVVPFLGMRFLKQEWRRQKIYIACSQRDREWTNRTVVEFLESLGQETFLPARDCPPNQLEIEAFAEGVVTCQKYVMVVSRHFLGQEQWTFERSLIVDELRRRQCCQEGEHPTCLLFVCLGASEVPGPRLGGTVLHWAQVRRRGALRFQLRSWLEETVFCEDEWNTWFLLGVSLLTAFSRSHMLRLILHRGRFWENWSVVKG